MTDFRRFAVYDTGPASLSQFGADWLGWNVATGRATDPIGPEHWTDTPRRYGFHATIKAPFRLAEDTSVAALEQAFLSLCEGHAPVALPRLTLAELDGFLALIPQPQPQALNDLEIAVVEQLDPFRAPLSEAERARRKPERLTESQRQNLDRWGYPYVGGEFRYHMTLTGQLSPEDAAAAREMLTAELAELLLAPHPVETLALMGEDAEGRFHVIRSAALSG